MNCADVVENCSHGFSTSVLFVTCKLSPPQDCLQPLSMQALPAQPESLCIVEMGGVEKQDEIGDKGTIGFLYLNIGLQVFLLHLSTSRKKTQHTLFFENR